MRSVRRIQVASGPVNDTTVVTINGEVVRITLHAPDRARIYAIDVVYAAPLGIAEQSPSRLGEATTRFCKECEDA